MGQKTQRENAKQAIITPQGSELYFRHLLEQLPAGAYTCDPDGLITYYNRYAVQVWGREPNLNDPAERYCGSFKLFAKDGSPLEHAECWMALALKEDRSYTGEEIVVERPDGRRFTVLVYASPIHDEAGRLLGAVNVLVDISARKQVEKRLAYQTTLLDALTESVLDGILIVSPEGRILHYNQRFADIWKFPREVLEDKSDEAALRWAARQTSDPAAFMARVKTIYAQPEQEAREEIQMKDGRVYERFGAPLQGESGDSLGWVWTFRDVTERKRVEGRLRESEERFRYAADAAPVLIWTADTAKNRTWFNQSWLEFTGRALEQDLGDGWTEGVHPDDYERCLTSYHAAFDAREPLSLRYRLRRGDGEYRWVLDTAVPSFAPTGEFLGYIGSCVDVTDSTRAEEKLRESEERFRHLTNAVPPLVWTTDAGGRSTYFNESWLKYTGQSAEEALAPGGAAKVIHPQDLAGTVARWRDVAAAGEPFAYEYRLRRRDGVYEWHLARAVPIFEGGRIVEWVGSAINVHSQKQVEATLRESEARYRALVEAGGTAVWRTDARGELIWTNEAFERLSGLSLKRAQGEGWLDVIHPEDRPQADEAWRRAFATKTPYNVEHRVRGADGRYRWVHSRAVPVLAEDGTVREWVGADSDISERKEAEEALAASEAKYATAFQAGPMVLTLTRLEDGSFLEVNERFLELSGYRREEVLGKTAEALGLWLEPEKRLEGLKRLQNNETLRDVEARFRMKDGSVRTFLVAADLVEIGGETCVHTALVDISARRKAENALRESEERYRTLFESIDEGFCIIEVLFGDDGRPCDYRFLEVNPAFEKQTGLKDAQGKTMLELAPEHEAHWFETYGKVALTGESVRFESPSAALGRWFDVYAFRLGPPEQRTVAVLFKDITARKRASEDQLRLATIVESSDDAIISMSLGGVVLSWNRAAERIFGYRAEEMLGQSITRLYANDSEAELLERLRRGETIDHFETVRRTKSGETIDVSVSISPLRDGSGDLVGASKIVRDITASRRAAAELRKSEERLRLALLAGGMGTFEWNLLTDELFLDEAERRLTGMDPGAGPLTGKSFWAQVHPDDRPELQRRIDQAREGRSDYHHEFRLLLPDGGERWLSGRGHFVYDEQGRATHLFGINWDVTSRKLAEQRLGSLVRSSALLSASLDYSSTLQKVAGLIVPELADWCVVDMLSDEGKLESIAVAHVDPEKIGFARELRRRYPPDLNAPRGLAQVLRSGEPEFYPEIPFELLERTAQDAEQLELYKQVGFQSAMIVPLIAREQVLGALTLVWAESKRHYTEEDLRFAVELAQRAAVAVDNARLYREAQLSQVQLLELNQQLEQRVAERTAQLATINRELEAFNYSVSHDLRAPLRGIDGFSQALWEEYRDRLDDTGVHYLRRIQAAAQRMGELIDDLLDLSRLSRSEVRLKEVDLSELAQRVNEGLRNLYPERRVQLDIAAGLVALGDPRMLKIALENLFANAWKFTQARERAEISFGQTADGAYYVRDNGAGFNMAYAAKLFTPFQRLHSPKEFEGSGIGLATVQRVVHRHGGRIWAESAPDQGATFYFTLQAEAGVGEADEQLSWG